LIDPLACNFTQLLRYTYWSWKTRNCGGDKPVSYRELATVCWA